MEMGRRDLMKRGGADKKSGSGYTAKSKKRMLKKLKEEFSHHSDLENEVSKKESKVPKRNLKDTNGVDHASVPRKLRSAMMKKRNLESVSKLSSVSKRLNKSKSESCKKELVKKEDQELVGFVSESMMISNDEKEVAETLYGLAGMFAESEAIDKKTCHEKEASKLESKQADSTQAEPVVSVLSSAKTKELDAKPLVQSYNSGMVDVIDGLKQSSSVNATDAPAKALETKVALWPGLSSTVQSGAQVHSKSSSTKLPAWMGQAAASSMSTSLLSEPLRVQPKKLKRCASHIYISRLIKVLQTSKTSPTTLNQTEQRSSETSEHKLLDPVTTISDFKTMVSPAKMYQTPHLLDLQRTNNPTPVPEDRTQLGLNLYGPHTSKKQSYDFLTLSSSGPTQSHHLPLPNPSLQYHISAAYNSHLSPASSSHQGQQLSPYLASRFQTAYNANQQQQLQRRLWSTAQYRPQYTKPNLSLNLTSIQQPLQVVSQQKHRLMAATAAAISMNHHHNDNPSRTVVMNRSQEHHFPFTYEDTRTSLQLLCNEHT